MYYAPVICHQGIFDFSLCKAQVYAWHCGDLFMVKVLPKALFKSCQVNVKYSGLFEHGIKWHCRDDTELKAWHLSPSIPGPVGPWLQMTGALQVLRLRVSEKKDKKMVSYIIDITCHWTFFSNITSLATFWNAKSPIFFHFPSPNFCRTVPSNLCSPMSGVDYSAKTRY